MAKRSPYAGTYPPSNLGLSKGDITKGLKGTKIKFPNRNLTSTSYKAGLKKETKSSENK